MFTTNFDCDRMQETDETRIEMYDTVRHPSPISP